MSATSGFPTVGVLGGGQLGRMLAMAATRLGVSIRFYDPAGSGPSEGLGERFVGSYDDAELLARFLEGCDVITIENEWAELDTLAELLPADVPLHPGRGSLELIADKIVQKRHAEESGIAVGPYAACTSADQAVDAARSLGMPVVMKRPTHGYDGYGNATARDEAEVREAFEKLGGGGQVLVEAFVPFVRELSVLVVRGVDGEDVAYPVAHTRQENHRCESVEVPAPVTPAVAEAAQALGRRAADAFGIVGVLAVEMFELESGELLLNEVAPRPHNSGHYTIEACATSQFENHLRAVLGWPLGDTSLLRPAAAMVNILGTREGVASADNLRPALQIPRVFVHIYGKRNVRPGRKMGHVTVVDDDPAEALERARSAARSLEL